ncbi:unnamed protein product [marine sediment metagenome]|uniref:Uncharacterized protein n=1 Tax=marine sediment metagenome TaxID=412755 RepID=X1ENM0_9ZZZZ
MGKSSGVALAIISLLIGAGGLGIGVYCYLTFGERITELEGELEDRSIKGTWYAELLEDWKPTLTNTNETIPDLTISFQVKEGESVYFLFISRAIIYKYSVESYLRFTFSIDGIILHAPYTIAGGRNIDETWLYFPVALQYSTDTLAAGNHTVSVIVLQSYGSNFIRHSTFLVQTYIP